MMAAGTGGHVFPALAVAKQLQQQGYKISWLVTPTGIENRLLEKEIQIHRVVIDIQGLRGNGLKRTLLAPFKIVKAMFATMQYMKQYKVDVVAGFGGYVAGPGGLAAKVLGIPILIHEQNAIAGFTNTQLVRIAKVVCQAFPNTFPKQQKVITTGNPIRAEISDTLSPQSRYDEREKAGQPLHVLVVGGSLGAQALNKVVPQTLRRFDCALDILHQCGQQQLESTQEGYIGVNNSMVNVKVQPFIENMAQAYSDADLIICRAGALTVTEIATAGVASVFVPLPSAVDDHQTANAQYLVKHGAAKLCHQKDMTVDYLYELLTPLMNRQVLADMAVKARQLAQPEATHHVATLVQQLARLKQENDYATIK